MFMGIGVEGPQCSWNVAGLNTYVGNEKSDTLNHQPFKLAQYQL